MTLTVDPTPLTAPDFADPPEPRPTAESTWQRTYSRVLFTVDAAVITLAAIAAMLLRFGTDGAALRGGSHGMTYGVSYDAVVAAAVPIWLLVLVLSRAYEDRFLGVGSEEFKRVANASVRLIAAVAVASYALKLDIARGFVAIALPLGSALLLAGRYGARRWLHRQRRYGRCCHRVLVVGRPDPVAELITEVRRVPYAGLTVVGACLPAFAATPAGFGSDVPVVGSLTGVVAAVRAVRADTVAVTASPGMSANALRRLSWALEGSGVDLIVAPALTNVAGPRISIRPVAGLPLLQLEEPEFGGVRQLLKTVVERVASALLLVLLSPLLAVVAVAVKLGSRGPVFYRQVRVGRGGGCFTLYKFRTMRDKADQVVGELAAYNDCAGGVLFKIRHDPRVTSVGRWLRRHSLDELPQLFNVVRGDMALVGPRPPLPGEVERYADDVHRRLLVKPGITGLWQVSGRSDLSWEDSVRLDLYYVENWSVTLDLMIVWKTAFAMLRPSGAY